MCGAHAAKSVDCAGPIRARMPTSPILSRIVRDTEDCARQWRAGIYVVFPKGEALSIDAEPIPERFHQNDGRTVRADACRRDHSPAPDGAFLAVESLVLTDQPFLHPGPICARIPEF